MRFEVPQFIEVEDKIFGPLTWRQFLYLGGGVGMAVVIFFTLPIVMFVLVSIPLALLSAALAFYRVNNQPFSFFLEAIFNYLGSQRLYLWRQNSNIIHRAMPEKEQLDRRIDVPPTPTNEPTDDNPTNNVTSLARRLELQALQKTQ